VVVRAHAVGVAARGSFGAALWLAWAAVAAAGQATGTDALVARLDSLARAHIESGIIPGVSVAVVQDGEPLLVHGYGMVDLEWDVPTPSDAGASYEIGSVTKQFTAASVLLLAEDGKLDLDADMTEYLDFDSQGHAVPVRRLLDHTSGIKSYTELPIFGELMTRKLPRDTLVHVVEREPFDFEPGTALIYNNSGYFLLGLIIEKVSGEKYEDFVRERLFEPIGMDDSYYCSEAEVRKRRAHGYDAVSPEKLIRARYLDQTWPYAAGSLCSTVADLVRWNEALHGGDVLSAESYEAMTTPAPLEDGTPIRYAMGLSILNEGGHRLITHGGGINGFLSDGRYYPDDDLIVIVLQNATGPKGPGALGEALAEAVLGPFEALVGTPYSGDLSELVGAYTGPSRGRPLTMTVSVDDGVLAFEPSMGAKIRPLHLSGLTWGQGSRRLTP
jgi:CubicO group peptidase (beta-lactamase class C family)